MTARGLRPGVVSHNWVNYTPKLRVLTVGGGSTQPSYLSDCNDASAPQGRYQIMAGGICVVQIQYAFLVGASTGVGDAYVFNLPAPIDRQNYPLVEGTGMAYQSFQSPTLVLPLTPTTLPPGLFAAEMGASEEERHVAFRYPYYFEWGSGTRPSPAATTHTISHSCPWTPDPQEINYVMAGNPGGTTQSYPCWVNTTSADFTVTTRSNVLTTSDYGWTMRAVPSGGVHSLIGPKKPWVWSALETIFVQLYYATRV